MAWAPGLWGCARRGRQEQKAANLEAAGLVLGAVPVGSIPRTRWTLAQERWGGQLRRRWGLVRSEMQVRRCRGEQRRRWRVFIHPDTGVHLPGPGFWSSGSPMGGAPPFFPSHLVPCLHGSLTPPTPATSQNARRQPTGVQREGAPGGPWSRTRRGRLAGTSSLISC